MPGIVAWRQSAPSVHDGIGRQMAQAFGQAQALDRVFAEQQGVLQVEAFGVGAVQVLVEAGAGQVVGGAAIAQFQDPLGVDQRIEVVVVAQVQLAQVARQALEHLLRAGGGQVLGGQLDVRPVLALQQFTAVVGVQAAPAAGVEQVIGAGHAQ